jgi:hypothetical protein
MLGALLVCGCGLGFVTISLRTSGRLPVLTLARAVPAGQVLTASDLRTAQVAAEVDTGVVPAAERDGVIGRTVAVPRPAGSLLFRGDIGPAAFPPPGQAVAAIAVKPGQYPPGLTVGARVAVVLALPTADAVRAAGGLADSRRRVAAVADISEGAANGAGGAGAVVSLLMSEEDAAETAAVQQLSLVLLAPSHRGGS